MQLNAAAYLPETFKNTCLIVSIQVWELKEKAPAFRAQKEKAAHSSALAENPVHVGAWRAAVRGVAQSRTRLQRLSMHACTGEGKGSPLRCSCLENPRDGGARWAAVRGVAQSRTRLKRLSSSSRCLPNRNASLFLAACSGLLFEFPCNNALS